MPSEPSHYAIPFPPVLGYCCLHYKLYHIIVTSVTLCGLRHRNILTRKVPGSYEEPRQVRAAQLLPATPSRGNPLPSSRQKICCRREAEQGKEFWRSLFGGKIAATEESQLGQTKEMQTYTPLSPPSWP